MGGRRLGSTIELWLMNLTQLDEYATDAGAWRHWAKVNYTASVTLFDSGNLFLWLPAATLGHHALEMYLKAALICADFAVFDPDKGKFVNSASVLTKNDSAWGHNLVK